MRTQFNFIIKEVIARGNSNPVWLNSRCCKTGLDDCVLEVSRIGARTAIYATGTATDVYVPHLVVTTGVWGLCKHLRAKPRERNKSEKEKNREQRLVKICHGKLCSWVTDSIARS